MVYTTLTNELPNKLKIIRKVLKPHRLISQCPRQNEKSANTTEPANATQGTRPQTGQRPIKAGRRDAPPHPTIQPKHQSIPCTRPPPPAQRPSNNNNNDSSPPPPDRPRKAKDDYAVPHMNINTASPTTKVTSESRKNGEAEEKKKIS